MQQLIGVVVPMSLKPALRNTSNACSSPGTNPGESELKSPTAISGPLTLAIALANSLACFARMLGTWVRSSKASRWVFANVNHLPPRIFARVDSHPRSDVTVTNPATFTLKLFFFLYCAPCRSLV